MTFTNIYSIYINAVLFQQTRVVEKRVTMYFLNGLLFQITKSRNFRKSILYLMLAIALNYNIAKYGHAISASPYSFWNFHQLRRDILSFFHILKFQENFLADLHFPLQNVVLSYLYYWSSNVWDPFNQPVINVRSEILIVWVPFEICNNRRT